MDEQRKRMEDKRKRSEKFAVFLACVFIVLFSEILAAVVFGHLAPEDKTAVIGWGSTILGILGTAAAYEWGSSKDRSEPGPSARAPVPHAPGTITMKVEGGDDVTKATTPATPAQPQGAKT